MSVEIGAVVGHLNPMKNSLDDARQIGGLERACPVRTAISVISGKWKPAILRSIHGDFRRYAEIRSQVADISDQSLTRHLRELSADGVIQRGSDSSYHLTPNGAQLADIMEALETWGETYLETRKGKSA